MKGRPITEQEFEQLLKSVEGIVGKESADSWKYILRGLWNSALRMNELMHVSWDIPGTIQPVWREGELPVLVIPAALQKNDTDEEIPLLPWFEEVLLETPPADRTGWVFKPGSLQTQLGRPSSGKRPKSDWVGRVISRIGKASGIMVAEADEYTGRSQKFVSAHDLRRSCGERLRNAGIEPLLICRVMRHSSWDTTQKHYAPGNIQTEAHSLREKLSNHKM